MIIDNTISVYIDTAELIPRRDIDQIIVITIIQYVYYAEAI